MAAAAAVKAVPTDAGEPVCCLVYNAGSYSTARRHHCRCCTCARAQLANYIKTRTHGEWYANAIFLHASDRAAAGEGGWVS